MSFLDKQFINIVNTILKEGSYQKNRTGIDTITYPGVMIRHNMDDGFPLLTLRRIPYKSAFVEMYGFIHGITDKQWYKDNNCHFWDYWCSPKKIQGNTNIKEQMYIENDLGPIYGSQWRNFNSSGYDQFLKIVNDLKNNNISRRMLCSAWNPNELHNMALPPCHFAWQVNVVNNKLNLFFHQRSCDFVLGNNLVGYGLLLSLLAKEANLNAGMLIATYNDCHIYVNHIEGVNKLLNRSTDKQLPTLKLNHNCSILEWKPSDCILLNYEYHSPQIKFPVAV